MAFSVFGSVPVPKKGRTNFNESHSVSGSFPLSQVIPVFMTETIPGDQWKINAYNLTKLETLISPAMQQVNASLLWFKIPKRLLMKKFKDWYSGGVDGNDTTQKPHIYLRYFLWSVFTDLFNEDETAMNEWLQDYLGPGSLWQYMGLPAPLKFNSVTGAWIVMEIDEIIAYDQQTSEWLEPDKVDSDYVDILPFMAYWMLYDQYFRDQTLCDPMFNDSESFDFTIARSSLEFKYNNNTYHVNSSGENLCEESEIQYVDFLFLLGTFNRAWQKEYFTSALPTPQRGPEVKINFTETSVPVTGTDVDFEIRAKNLGSQSYVDPREKIFNRSDIDIDNPSSEMLINGSDQGQDHDFETSLDIKGDNLRADLSGLSPIAITAFRNLFKLQAFLEKNNIGGGRFIETILAQWGERVPDFTVQRAQYIRATSIPVQISEVLATANSATGVNRTVGDQAGLARTQGNLGNVHIYTHEPSFIFGVYCVTCPPSYAGQGIPRLFQRITRFDEPWRDFQHIGEQAIKLRELYYPYAIEDMNKSDQDFGYQQRFSEYKYMPNRVVGDFITSLSYWHMARMFNKPPQLNADFVTQHLDERIFAVQSARPVLSDFYFQAVAKRKLSKFSTPKLT